MVDSVDTRRTKLEQLLAGLLHEQPHHPTDPNMNDCTCEEFLNYVPLTTEPSTCLHLQVRAALKR